MTQFNIGDIVEVTARNGGLFNSSNYGEQGTVVSVNTTSQILHVDFDDGRDYGNFQDVRVIRRTANPLTIGARVQVTAPSGGRFLSRFAGKFGTVVEMDEDDVTVEFEEGGQTDYGNHSDVKVVAPANAQIAPRPADVAKNGMTVGDRVRVNSEESKRGSFYTRYCGKTGTITSIAANGDAVHVRFDNDGGTDVGYTTGVVLVERGPNSGWIENKGAMPVARDTLIDVKYRDGLVMLNVEAGSNSYGNSTILKGTGTSKRYARAWSLGNSAGTITHYRLALPVVGGETLEAQLASLRAQHNAIKAEKQAAEAEVAAARTKVNEIEARRVALVSVLTANGLQFAE
ncbi:hypothetical protein uav_029 [Pseudomonas phage UAVern]|uniref:Uncharacterized protein n=1 Tax=Pseudomonas phage UAVern TaxID=2856997 RepID=A0A975UUX1_9CAUD|nr:hypothetical protein uav_029 [Pseudomonas phage UAVern]